jgi:hypothetical protein
MLNNPLIRDVHKGPDFAKHRLYRCVDCRAVLTGTEIEFGCTCGGTEFKTVTRCSDREMYDAVQRGFPLDEADFMHVDDRLMQKIGGRISDDDLRKG